MNISKFFIDRPIFAGVLSVIILLAGLLAVFQLPISEYPEVVPPSVVVRAQYPGANPKVIAETVASPLEESINGVENMLYMQSQANSDRNLAVTVNFKLGTDPATGQLRDARVAQPAKSCPARTDRNRCGARDPRTERAGCRRRDRRLAQWRGRSAAAVGECARPAAERSRVRRHRPQDIGGRRRDTAG